jgi:hypothetical protein
MFTERSSGMLGEAGTVTWLRIVHTYPQQNNRCSIAPVAPMHTMQPVIALVVEQHGMEAMAVGRCCGALDHEAVRATSLDVEPRQNWAIFFFCIPSLLEVPGPLLDAQCAKLFRCSVCLPQHV